MYHVKTTLLYHPSPREKGKPEEKGDIRSYLTPPICSPIHPAVFNFASILAAEIP